MTAAPTHFELAGPPVLARSAVRRDEPLRTDRARQLAGWPAARLVVVDAGGRTPVDGLDGAGGGRGGFLGRLRTRQATGAAPPDGAVLLGEIDGTAYWAVRAEPEGAGQAGDPAAGWADLRVAGATLGERDTGLFTTAVALLQWHDTARFCSRDGSPTRPSGGGWHRLCEAAGHEEYPRTDPAMICLVHDGADRVLLARQPSWPQRRYSVLAGFVEAGESLEACVRREVHEEVGVEVRGVRYLGSQAWPFPRSLMVAFHAVADPGAPLRPAEGEIAEAFWCDRAQVRDALARGDWTSAAEAGQAAVLLPGRVSIAHSMLAAWAGRP